MRARVFIDFWNFQLGWNEATSKTKNCDWSILPRVLVRTTGELLATAGGTWQGSHWRRRSSMPRSTTPAIPTCGTG